MSEIPRSQAYIEGPSDEGDLPGYDGDDGTPPTVEAKDELTIRLLEIEQQAAREGLSVEEMQDLISGLLDLHRIVEGHVDETAMRIEAIIIELYDRIGALDMSREDGAMVVAAASVASSGLRRVA